MGMMLNAVNNGDNNCQITSKTSDVHGFYFSRSTVKNTELSVNCFKGISTTTKIETNK